MVPGARFELASADYLSLTPYKEAVLPLNYPGDALSVLSLSRVLDLRVPLLIRCRVVRCFRFLLVSDRHL